MNNHAQGTSGNTDSMPPGLRETIHTNVSQDSSSCFCEIWSGIEDICLNIERQAELPSENNPSASSTPNCFCNPNLDASQLPCYDPSIDFSCNFERQDELPSVYHPSTSSPSNCYCKPNLNASQLPCYDPSIDVPASVTAPQKRSRKEIHSLTPECELACQPKATTSHTPKKSLRSPCAYDDIMSFVSEEMYRMNLSQPFPPDIAMALALIKRGKKVTMKELRTMLERLKHVDPPILITAFRPSNKYSYAYGSRYPGTVFGHQTCAPRPRRVPGLKGWRWDPRAPLRRMQKRTPSPDSPEGTWRPGAICNSLKDRVKAPQRAVRPFGQALRPRRLSAEHLCLDEGKIDEDQFEPKPTLHIHRYQGDFFVSMHPDDLAGENVPLQFRIINKEKKPVTCQDSDSELEIELFQPGAFYTVPKAELSDMKTQCDEQYLVENYQPPPKVIVATELPKPPKPPKKGKKKGKKGKKGKKKKKK